MNQESRRVAKAAGVMIITIFISRVLGQLRETLIAVWFGQNIDTDIYRAAFSIPDLLFFLLAGGALSSAFIPVFTEYMTGGQKAADTGGGSGEEEAWKVFSIIATFLSIVIGILVILGEIFARQIVPFLAPGFSPEALDRTANLSRIVLPAQICFFLGGLMMAAHYVKGYFLIPALGPIVYNLGIILGGWFLGRMGGLGVEGLSWGALIGALIGNFLLQMILFVRIGGRFRPSLHLRHPGVIKAGKLVLPIIIGMSMPQVYVLVNRYFGSMLQEGVISALDNANKIMQAPLGIFAQAISVALFPAMAAMVSRGDRAGFHRTFSQGVRALWFATLPLSLLMMILAPDIVSVLLQYRRFTPDDTLVTSQALVFYSIGLCAFSCQAIMNKAFYAVQDTMTPVIIGTLSSVIFIFLNMVLIGPLTYKGLALAGSLAAIIHVLMMLGAMKWRTGIEVRGFFKPLARILAASLVCGAVAWGARIGWGRFGHSFGLYDKLDSILTITLVSIAGSVAFLAAARLLRCEEYETVRGIIARRLRR